MKTQTYVSWVMASLLIGSTALLAESGDYGLDTPSAWKEAAGHKVKHTDSFGDTYYTDSYKEPKRCVADAVKKLSQPVKNAPKEVLEALQATFDADRALRQQQDKQAAEQLKHAHEQFRAAFKADPGLKWIPVDADILVDGTVASAKELSAILEAADAAISAHRTQEARELLMPLRDEIDVTTLYLPAEAYADAVQKSQKALKRGDRVAARQELHMAFGLLVSERLVIPIPLLEAESLVSDAAELQKSEKAKRSELLDEALADLEKAELLGYTGRHSREYTDLSRQIRQIKTADAGEGGKLYRALKKDFGKLLDAVEGEIPFVGS
jgi:hypothetical protein